jgi:signal transduction histidine kinase
VVEATATRQAAPRGSVVPARWRIVGWILLIATLGLTAVVVTVRSAMLAEVVRTANEDLVQEAEEVKEFARIGRDPETARPFTSTERLLTVYLERQYPGDNEELVGYLPQGRQVLAVDRDRDADERATYDLATDGRDLLRRLVASGRLSGVADTPAGEMIWGRVDLAVTSAQDAGGSLIIAEFTAGPNAKVADIVQTVMLVAAGGLLLTAGIAWLVAGAILAPVRTVRRAAAEITEHDLTRRIQVRGRDDIAALAITFNGMLDRLEGAFATQRRFVDDASHELRTPITIIRGQLELIGDTPSERASTINLVTTELDRMNRIVGDLLVLAKSQRPDFVRREPVDLADLTLEIDAKVSALGDRRWMLAGVAEGIVALDPQRITQAVLQLAQNAVQHTSDGEEIRIASQRHGDHVTFWVRDSGPGVQDDEVEMIFGRFTRGSAPTPADERSGAGLGLAIVRAIAESHGGHAYVESRPGGGATFGIDIPVAQGAPRRTVARRRDAAPDRATTGSAQNGEAGASPATGMAPVVKS